MKKFTGRKILILIFVITVIGIAVWQIAQSRETPPLSSTPQSSQTQPLESDHTLETSTAESDSSSFIESLRKRDFKGGEIKMEDTLDQNNAYTSYLISYPSDDLTIYGVMNIPQGNGPFPVIILNHGYYSPSSFVSGNGTQTIADILAKRGYLTLASDYRGHGKSENDSGSRGGHRPEYAIDVLNLIASIQSIDKADPNRIGMWGHSMGGEVSLRTIEATDKVKAVALWAPTSGNAADNHAFYGGRRNEANEENPELYGVSPINYLKYISSPISIHQGLEDTEVKPEWSQELRDALKKENKTVEYFEYEGQDHNFRNLGWDVVSERTITFYDKYLK
jgi:uncharacterized protein